MIVEITSIVSAIAAVGAVTMSIINSRKIAAVHTSTSTAA